MDNKNVKFKDIVSTAWLDVNEEALYWPKKMKADLLKIDINEVDIIIYTKIQEIHGPYSKYRWYHIYSIY